MTQPAGLASVNRGTGMVLYGRGQLGSTRYKTCSLPPFSHLAVLFIYGVHYADRQYAIERYCGLICFLGAKLSFCHQSFHSLSKR